MPVFQVSSMSLASPRDHVKIWVTYLDPIDEPVGAVMCVVVFDGDACDLRTNQNKYINSFIILYS
jgi:hypothetical protein